MHHITNYRATADLLWSAMLVRPEFAAGSSRLGKMWRERVYPYIVNHQVSRIQRHRSPEPWLTLNCGLQVLSGDGCHRSQLRYMGVVGGATTEREYEALLDGQFLAPVLLVGGYPRTGTTSVQAAVRRAFHTHVPEFATSESRFSLWEYPKHDVEMFAALADRGDSNVKLLVTARNFEDSLASLAVGRGSLESVNIDLKIQRWLAWMKLAQSHATLTIPFEYVTTTSPLELAVQLSRTLGVGIDRMMPADQTYGGLMIASGKGDSENPRQSNVPSSDRCEELNAVREEITRRLGQAKIDEMTEIYREVRQSAMLALGTVDPA